VPKPSLPVRLALLVAGTALPLIVFAAFIVFEDYEHDRREASQRVLETVRSIRLVLDAEVTRITGGLEVLALTNTLRNGDFDGFRHTASGFLAQYGKDGILLVADREGRQLFSSTTTDTPSLPLRNNREIVEKVFATKTRQYSNLFLGATTKRPMVTIEVPVISDGDVIYDISFSPPIDIFQSILDKQRPNDDWTISIFDRDGINFARVPNPKETVGKRATPLPYTTMSREAEATLQAVSLESTPQITTFARSPLTGWTVAAGIAQGSLVGPLWRNLAITSALGAVLLLTGLAFAVRMATTIARGEMLHDLLIEELNHRVKNALAVVQALASETLAGSASLEEFGIAFKGRLAALAQGHGLLLRRDWVSADLMQLLRDVTNVIDPARVLAEGPNVELSPRKALAVYLTLHELLTNATKYGALSREGGQVAICWTKTDKGAIRLIWQEKGGPPVKRPDREGFGAKLIRQLAEYELDGDCDLRYEPKGLRYELTFPAQ